MKTTKVQETAQKIQNTPNKPSTKQHRKPGDFAPLPDMPVLLDTLPEIDEVLAPDVPFVHVITEEGEIVGYRIPEVGEEVAQNEIAIKTSTIPVGFFAPGDYVMYKLVADKITPKTQKEIHLDKNQDNQIRIENLERLKSCTVHLDVKNENELFGYGHFTVTKKDINFNKNQLEAAEILKNKEVKFIDAFGNLVKLSVEDGKKVIELQVVRSAEVAVAVVIELAKEYHRIPKV